MRVVLNPNPSANTFMQGGAIKTFPGTVTDPGDGLLKAAAFERKPHEADETVFLGSKNPEKAKLVNYQVPDPSAEMAGIGTGPVACWVEIDPASRLPLRLTSAPGSAASAALAMLREEAEKHRQEAVVLKALNDKLTESLGRAQKDLETLDAKNKDLATANEAAKAEILVLTRQLDEATKPGKKGKNASAE